MKLLITIIIVLISLNINAQSLKRYTLGEKLVGTSREMTTVAGIEGGVAVGTLNDGTIAAVGFIPCTSNGEQVTRISETDFNRLKIAIEKNYGISFIKEEEEYTRNFTYYATSTNNAFYTITVEYNQFLDNPYQISFMITTLKLIDMLEKEKQKKANSDF
jgi:hypothetical protein